VALVAAPGKIAARIRKQAARAYTAFSSPPHQIVAQSQAILSNALIHHLSGFLDYCVS